MDDIRGIITSVCIFSAASCLIEGLTAGTKLKNQMSFVINLIFITMIAAPFVKGTFSLELPDFESYEISGFSGTESLYTEEFRKKTGENISSVLLQQLEAAGIRCSSIETIINISETNSISISSVTVSTDNFNAAAEIIRNSLGEDTEVLNGNN